MPTKTKSRSANRKRGSSPKLKVKRAGKKRGKKRPAAGRKPKSKAGRTARRPKVTREAAKLAKVRAKAQQLLETIQQQTSAPSATPVES